MRPEPRSTAYWRRESTRRSLLALAAAILWIGGGCKLPDTAPAAESSGAAPAAVHAEAKHWSYVGETGPLHWGELDPEYALCTKGREQSPVDIRDPRRRRSLHALEFQYAPTKAVVVNNGHTIQANLEPGNRLVAENKRFELLQFHFHAPSEHSILGDSAPLEIHLVHKAADGELAVVGLMANDGEANAVLKDFMVMMPAKPGEGEKEISVDLAALVPDSPNYYTYRGSLTTPPCTEGVRWFVMKEPVSVSAEQVAALKKIVGDNARPIQPLYDRFVEEY